MLQNNGGIMANTINVKAFEGLLKKQLALMIIL